MPKRTCLTTIAVSISSLAIVAPAANAGGITVFEDGDKYAKVGGRIQLQYHNANPDGASSSDEVFFRRFRPYIEGGIHEDWTGKFQFDLGKAEDGDEVALKDAYMQYSGLPHMNLKVGNAEFPFAREFLTSSKYQHLVERTFVGDHNYGTPDRNVGIHLDGEAAGDMVTWRASVVSAAIDPDAAKLDFDSPVNRNSDFNEGWMYGARVDVHPFGKLKFSQGDFDRVQKATIGVAAFAWNNDDDNNTRTTNDSADDAAKPDVERVTGFEVSAAYRNLGFSIDGEYNHFNAETVDAMVTRGIFKNGATDLDNYSVEGGHMVIPGRLEVVAGYQAQDADNYAKVWSRISGGLNWFIHEHDVKLQLTFRNNSNVDGQSGADENEIFLQSQFVI